jgi:hypothetical protein
VDTSAALHPCVGPRQHRCRRSPRLCRRCAATVGGVLRDYAYGPWSEVLRLHAMMLREFPSPRRRSPAGTLLDRGSGHRGCSSELREPGFPCPSQRRENADGWRSSP